MAKPKVRQSKSSKAGARMRGSVHNEQKLHKARQQHAAGAIDADDFVWTVMQCYADEVRSKA